MSVFLIFSSFLFPLLISSIPTAWTRVSHMGTAHLVSSASAWLPQRACPAPPSSELAPRLLPPSSPRASFLRARPAPTRCQRSVAGEAACLRSPTRRPARRRLSPAWRPARQRARPAGFLHLRAPARPSFFLPSSPARPRGRSSPAQRRRRLRLVVAGPCPSSAHLLSYSTSASERLVPLGMAPSEKFEGTE